MEVKAIMDDRVGRVRQGNFGDCKSIKDGVSELRIDHGPGYRIYFGQEGQKIVVLLAGGTKRTQEKDIKTAKKFWDDYKERVQNEKK